MPGQPPCQPEAVSSGFERNGDACDGQTFPDALVTPAMQHAQQFRFVRRDLLQWLALDPWNGPSYQPARLTELNHGDQGGCRTVGKSGNLRKCLTGISRSQ
jgi:hypothetical protein